MSLSGGLGDHITPYDVDPVELALGSTVEMEHTNNPWIAIEIALDHLAEFPNYYTAILLPAEKKAKRVNSYRLKEKGKNKKQKKCKL